MLSTLIKISIKHLLLDNIKIFYLLPDDLSTLNRYETTQQPYELTDQDGNGLDQQYYFIQIKNDTLIKKRDINQTFPAQTLFFMKKKDSETAHKYLAKLLLGLDDEVLLSAGELDIQKNQLNSWNLRSGAYWTVLKLNQKSTAEKVGFPMNKWKTVDDPLDEEPNYMRDNLTSHSITSHGLFTERSRLLPNPSEESSACCCSIHPFNQCVIL